MFEDLSEVIAALPEKMTLSKFHADMYSGALRSTANPRFQDMVDSALPELYAAIIVFAVKARNYLGARGEHTSHL